MFHHDVARGGHVFSAKIPEQDRPPIIAWCRSEFGPYSNDTWYYLHGQESLGIVIRRENDALAFKMRWC